MFLHSSAPVQLAAWFVFLHKPQTHPTPHSLYQPLLQSHRAVRSSPVPVYCCPRKHIEGSWTRRSDRDEGHQHPSLTPKSSSLYASFGPHRINKSHSTPEFSASNTFPMLQCGRIFEKAVGGSHFSLILRSTCNYIAQGAIHLRHPLLCTGYMASTSKARYSGPPSCTPSWQHIIIPTL